ncbi:MAG: DegT/DnrJ/EryC1/StrS family aminotransferase [Legionellaceae bacterium]|nr:DegT/DnrJ/EryC1/StrS family aminotransferase [Legionellaceae bacterium]
MIEQVEKMNIPITKAIFDQAEREAIVKPLASGWIVQGPNVQEFEQLFASYTGAKYAKAVSSCTTALHLALVALDVKAGDKVVVPSFTYVASANAVEYTGAEVVFCDIDLKTFNIDIQHLKALLENDSSIKAIMPVNLFGLCANLPEIQKLARAYAVKVVEDSACGFDAWIEDKHSGTLSDIGCFSFHPRKSITTGEGGMIITNDEAHYRVISQLCDHGASKSDLQRHREKGGSLLPDFTLRGYNYRMTDFQGALGVCQMKKASDIMSGRRFVTGKYNQALKEVRQLVQPYVPEHYTHGFQSYVCLFTGGETVESFANDLTIEKIDALNLKRNQFMEKLEVNGVATRQGTHAVHTLKYYKDRYQLSATDFLMSYAADRLSVTLPVYAGMDACEFEYVITQIKQALS